MEILKQSDSGLAVIQTADESKLMLAKQNKTKHGKKAPMCKEIKPY